MRDVLIAVEFLQAEVGQCRMTRLKAAMCSCYSMAVELVRMRCMWLMRCAVGTVAITVLRFALLVRAAPIFTWVDPPLVLASDALSRCRVVVSRARIVKLVRVVVHSSLEREWIGHSN